MNLGLFAGTLPIIKPESHGSGEKKLDSNLFCPHSEPKREPTPKSALKFGTFALFFDTFEFDTP